MLVSLALFFGWLLSFPFNGPLLYALVPGSHPDAPGLAIVFVFSLAAGFMAGALLIRTGAHWRGLMLGGLVLTVSLHVSLGFLAASQWPYAMSVLGLASALFVLGWSHPYTHWLRPQHRLRFMAAAIMLANVAYLAVNLLLQVVAPVPVFYLSLLLLLPVLPAVLGMRAAAAGHEQQSQSPAAPLLAPFVLILAISLFFFGFYVSGGLLYTVVFSTLADYEHLSVYLRYIPYILVLLAIWGPGARVRRHLLIYLSASLLGLAFVAFAIPSGTRAGYLVAEILFQAGFAMLDLYSWVILGDIAHLYRGKLTAYRVFGYGLGAQVGAIFVGQIIGQRLLQVGQDHRILTALFAIAVVLITYLIVPWLNEHLEGWFTVTQMGGLPWPETGPPEALVEALAVTEPLTTREKEIAALLLQGYSNRDVAALLHISQNTLKTHIRNLYRKAEVVQKRELIALAAKMRRD